MAITWVLTGKVTNLAEKRVSVVGTRTDSEDAENPQSYGPLSGPIATAAQKTAIKDQFWALKEEAEQKSIAAQAVLDTILASGEAALNQLEITNG